MVSLQPGRCESTVHPENCHPRQQAAARRPLHASPVSSSGRKRTVKVNFRTAPHRERREIRRGAIMFGNDFHRRDVRRCPVDSPRLAGRELTAPPRSPTSRRFPAVLEARSLTKYYSHTPAVKNVSFTIRPGEILGYLGPNGAGKSTTVKMLTGLIEPIRGPDLFKGRNVHDDFTGLPAPDRLRAGGAAPLSAPHRPRVSATGRPAARHAARRAWTANMDEVPAPFRLWERPPCAALVLFQRHAPEDPALRPRCCTIPRS